MPNDVPANVLTLTYNDFSNEVSSTTINIDQFADNPTYLTALGDLESAIAAITNGTQIARDASLPQRLSNAAGGAGSQREYKLLVRYEDSVTFERGSFTIPTFDVSTVTLITGTDNVDFSAPGVAQTLVNAIQAMVVSKAGNSINVLALKSVGRNL